MSTKVNEDENAYNTAADKKVMEDFQKVISDAETALIEQGRLATNIASDFVHDNRWNWR